MRIFQSYSRIAPETIDSWLVSDDENEQRLVNEALLRMSPDAQKAVCLSLLQRESRAYEALSTKRGMHVTFFCAGFAVVFSLVGLLLQPVTDPFQLAVLMPIVFLSLGVVFMAGIFQAPRYICPPESLLQKRVREKWLRRVTLEDLPELVEAARRSREGFQDFTTALVSLLPRMTAEHRALLDRRQWDFLGMLLVTPSVQALYKVSPDLKRAMVHAIGKADDERMRPILEKVARTTSDAPLSQLAKNYLSILPGVESGEAETRDTITTYATQHMTQSAEPEPIRQSIARR